ncbi:MAG TPA: WD40 repeat domain-containing protein [Bacteroidia bacterium]|nr:WD40 repeat domain-containing protein [Bacteroidia bacterium]
MKITATQKIIFRGHHGGVYGLAEGSEPGVIFSGSSDKFVGAWNMISGKQEEFAVEFRSPVYSLLHLPEKKILLAGAGDGTFHEIDIDKKIISKTVQLHTGQIFDLAISKKHGLIFVASADGKFSILDAKTIELKEQKKITDQKVRGFALSPDENLLAVTCGDGNIKIFSLPEMEEVNSFLAHNLSTNTVCWHPGGDYLLSGGRDAHLNVWDPKTNFIPIMKIPAHNFAIYHIAFSPDKKMFATASRDKSMKIWNAENFDLLLRCGKDGQNGHKNSVNRLIWNENGLISGSDDQSMIVWEVM